MKKKYTKPACEMIVMEVSNYVLGWSTEEDQDNATAKQYNMEYSDDTDSELQSYNPWTTD